MWELSLKTADLAALAFKDIDDSESETPINIYLCTTKSRVRTPLDRELYLELVELLKTKISDNSANNKVRKRHKGHTKARALYFQCQHK